jgi:hypothetical protein
MLGLVSACALAIGCAHHTSDTNPADATLDVAPATATLMILNGVAATQAYTATLKWPDGHTEDVTSNTSFTIDPNYGRFASATLSMNVAGQTTVMAKYTAESGSVNNGTAQVLATLQDTRLGSGVGSSAPAWFNGPEDPTRAPTIVYPVPNIIVPRNLGVFEAHWTDASSNDTWEIALSTDLTSVKVYTKGGNGAGGGPDPSWMDFLTTEWYDALANGSSVTLTVRGVNSQNPTAVGSAPPQAVTTTNENMNGGVYYWASESTDGSPYGIYRQDVSQPGQMASEFLTSAQTSMLPADANGCVACHVLSQDGTKMLVTYSGGNGTATTVNVANATPAASAASWNFATFTPDGNEFLAVYGGVLTVRNYATQAVAATMTVTPSTQQVSHPNLSDDGTQLVYVRPGTYSDDWTFGNGQIYIRSFNQATNTFGAEKLLVADSANNYYPTFSPDGKWVLYTKGDDTGNESYNNPNAQLYVTAADGSTGQIELTTANQGSGLANSWGRWAPFPQTVGASGSNADPSTVMFRLPFQDINTHNHIAQWTQAIVGVQ